MGLVKGQRPLKLSENKAAGYSYEVSMLYIS